MKITKRERSLLAITITAIVLGINFLLVVPLLRSWRETGTKLNQQRRERSSMKATIERLPQWSKEYDDLRQSLGRTEQFQQPSDVSKKINEVAGSSGVIVTGQRQMNAEDKGVYRVLPVQCSIDSTTEPLVKFLFALQTAAGFMSVEQLRITPRPENPSILRCDLQVRALAGKSGGTRS
jgi:Tfp pilus assembly protein PilO